MAHWLVEELTEGAKAFHERMGSGGTAGVVAGGAIALIAALSGAFNMPGWLSWLLVPVVATVGLLIGDAISQDGYVFGPKGVVNALKNKGKPKTIPEGYIAATPDAGVIAVRSEVLARNGEVHMPMPKYPDELLLGFKEARPLDPFVEFLLDDDGKFSGLRQRARDYGNKYADPASPDYIRDVHQREQTISRLVVGDIGQAYGPYSYETLDWHLNFAEFRSVFSLAAMVKGGRSTLLSETEKNSLVCRHYAPITSVLLHEARVPNHTVCSMINRMENKNGTYKLMAEPDTGGHIYVITDEGNAAVEGTLAGKPDRVNGIYRRIVNGVTVQDIIYKGKVAIPELQDKERTLCYGGHTGDGLYNNKEAALALAQQAMAEHNHNVAMKKAKEQASAPIAPAQEVQPAPLILPVAKKAAQNAI